MLAQLVFLALFHAITADPINNKPLYEVENFEAVGQLFEKFMKEYKRTYSGAEKFERFEYFVANLKKINEYNQNSEATFGINHFSDMSTEQMDRFYSGLRMVGDDTDGNCKKTKEPTSKDAPATLDWRDKNAVSPVKDQKICGSCWAFSATGLVESRYWAQGKKLVLSEQQLVDCDNASSGCNGGLMSLALTEIMNDGGQESEDDYPYEDKDGKCRFDQNKIVAKVKSCSTYSLTSEDALKELLFKEGPLAIAVAADDCWLGYTGGIMDKCQTTDLNHGVLLVGYGSEGGKDYWIIKNSWNEGWGENGYIRLKRGVNCSGINDPQSFSKVSAVVG